MGIPPESNLPVPAMVCVHGGGCKAFREWVEMWVDRGYAALAMDLGGRDGMTNVIADIVKAELPEGVSACFLSIKDDRGACVSSPCLEAPTPCSKQHASEDACFSGS